jgi:hypothetical protein
MKDDIIEILNGICICIIACLIIFGFVFLLWLVFGPSEEKVARDHAMQVIQELDGCQVYRFYDGNYHYVTRCGANVITRKNWDESCGKACTRHRTEEITTEGNQ